MLRTVAQRSGKRVGIFERIAQVVFLRIDDAGDVATTPYKQIIIAMGEGAKAALSAFEDRIRGALA